MQSAYFCQELGTWLGAKVIGIGKHDSAIEVFHLFAGDALHCSFGADGHVDGGEDLSVGEIDGEGPGESALAFEVALEGSFLLFDLFGNLLVLRYIRHQVINYQNHTGFHNLVTSSGQHLQSCHDYNIIIYKDRLH